MKIKGKTDWFRFSEDQWDQLKFYVGKYETGTGQGFQSNVNLFIMEVETTCAMLKKLQRAGDIVHNRDQFKDLKKSLQAARKHLRPICYHNKFQLVPQTHLDQTCGEKLAKGVKQEYNFFNAACSADHVTAWLLHHIELVEKEMDAKAKNKGRPKADTQDGFIGEIAAAFLKYLGKPTAYKDGPFASVVKIALKAVGRQCKDPSRAIRATIKNLKLN